MTSIVTSVSPVADEQYNLTERKRAREKEREREMEERINRCRLQRRAGAGDIMAGARGRR